MAELAFEASRPLSRREFLFYVWTASLALAMAGSGGAILWYAYPRFREGEFGGEFPLDRAALPEVGSDPQPYQEGRFWLVNTENGLLALYMVCTHLGCLYKWVPNSERFICPCHTSTYTKEGVKVSGPTSRNLDRFVIQAVDAEGDVVAETHQGDAAADAEAGAPLRVPDAAVQVLILTGEKVKGAPAT
jgi:cytochrome b6-f complex iron-sulfur subunit